MVAESNNNKNNNNNINKLKCQLRNEIRGRGIFRGWGDGKITTC